MVNQKEQKDPNTAMESGMDALSESLRVTARAQEIGLEPVTAYVPTPKQREAEMKARAASAAERQARQREKEAAEGIQPLSVKAKGDEAKAIIDQLAKASVEGRLEQYLDELAPAPAPQQAVPADPAPSGSTGRIRAALAGFGGGLVLGLLVGVLA